MIEPSMSTHRPGTVRVRRGADRGRADYGWLNSHHTFSFGDYYDPNQLGFRALRVINDDRVAAGAGFPSHPHRDMEIVTVVLDGAIEHKDSMGNGSVIRPGEIQRMSAGTGVVHSEYNHSESERLRFLQIWIFPDRRGTAPSYEQKSFSEEERRNQLRLVASPNGADGSVTLQQDVRLYTALLGSGQSITHELAPDRHAWLQVARGKVRLGEVLLVEGDGVAVSDADSVEVRGVEDAELLLFDLN